MSDMMRQISDKLRALPELQGVTIKPYYRPEALLKSASSIVIVPMAPPRQMTFGSDRPLRKEFTYQINIEASSKETCTQLALAVERVLLALGFIQLSGGLDEYFVETERYVDARRYRGYSDMYDIHY